MTGISFTLTQAGMKTILSGDSHLVDGPVTAALLNPGYSFEPMHASYGDVQDFELKSQDYAPRELTGKIVVDPAIFTSDPIHFGSPVSLGPVGSVALVCAYSGAFKSTSPLLAVGEFTQGPVESIRASFILTPSEAGWFSLIQP